MSTPELSLEFEPNLTVVNEQPELGCESVRVQHERSSFDNYNTAWSRRITASMEDIDPVKHVAANNFLAFLDILQTDLAPHNSPITLAELCPDCTPEELETNNLISNYLRNIPGIQISEVSTDSSLPLHIYQFKPHPVTSPKITMQVMRTEIPYIAPGKTIITYSVTQGIPAAN